MCSFSSKLSTVAVVFYEDVPNSVRDTAFAEIKRGLEKRFPVNVVMIRERRNLPESAYYRPRNRYKANLLLNDLINIRGYGRVLGVTYKDISVKKDTIPDWGIMGLAYQPGSVCVISSYRIDSPKLYVELTRLKKVAIHEIGHTFGIGHCNVSTCVMHAGSNIDKETDNFCPDCNKKLKEILGN